MGLRCTARGRRIIVRRPDPGSLLRTFALFIPRLLRWLLFPQSSSVVPVSDARLNLRLWGQPDMAATLCGLAKGGCVPLPAGHTLSHMETAQRPFRGFIVVSHLVGPSCLVTQQHLVKEIYLFQLNSQGKTTISVPLIQMPGS